MPRFHRVVRQYALIHIIVRFLNYDYVLASDEAKIAYLERVARYFAKSDWLLISYALMSTHVHFGAIAGATPLSKITQPLHNSFYHWLKRSGGRRRLGHVVASRPSSKELPLSAGQTLIAYHHNNPVKAGIVERASDSSWTSHRSYIHNQAADWLDVDLGLAMCNLSTSASDRARFDDLVQKHVGAELPDHDKELKAHRRMVRARLGTSIELGSPRQSSAGALVTDVFAPKHVVLHQAWPGDLQEIVEKVAAASQISVTAMRSKSRVRPVAKARRLFVLCAHVELRRPIGLVAAAVGISGQSARELEQTATAEQREQARTLANFIRQTPLV